AAVVVDRRRAEIGLGDDLAHARSPRRPLGVARMHPALAGTDVLGARGAVVAGGRRAREAHAAGTFLVRLSVAIVVDGRIARLHAGRHLADARPEARAVSLALLRSAVARPDVLGGGRSGVARRLRARRTRAAGAFLVGLSVAIVVAGRRARLGHGND